MRVSHETIYRSLFIQARGVLKKELIGHLRSRRTMRRSQRASTAGQPRGQIIDGVSIRDRPADVEDRAIPGHWEGDLMAGSKNTHMATLVERASRFTMLVKVPGKDTASVVTALSQHVRTLPSALRRSLTWDRGMELAQHKQLTIATNVQIYFCDPQSPWQRGTNENTNRLLRQYFPKGMDLSRYSQADLNTIALRLNHRPRKTLGFHTPAAILEAAVASTA
jgi:IS30 family transposase